MEKLSGITPRYTMTVVEAFKFQGQVLAAEV
jgi:hypothetical protein